MDRKFLLCRNVDEYCIPLIVRGNKWSKFSTIIALEDGEYNRITNIEYWFEFDESNDLIKEILKRKDQIAPELFSDTNSFLKEIFQKPGEYYTRIFRPFFNDKFGVTYLKETWNSVRFYGEPKFGECIPAHKSTILLSINQLSLLKNMIINIFQNVQPNTNNFKSYRHTIKNLLVLCCIEVEAHLQGILVANQVSPTGRFYTMTDYIKLKNVLQLDRYSVAFSFYKEIEPVQPFLNWNALNPTKSISWYSSYNKIKHEGVDSFEHASLENAISAISAVVILLNAQFGKNIPYWNEEIGPFFKVTNQIGWRVEDYIMPPIKGEEWKEQLMSI